MRYVDLGNGKTVSLRAYIRGWKAALELPPKVEVRDCPGTFGPASIEHVLCRLRDGLHDRINRHDPRYGRGRKWDPDWQRDAVQTAHRVNTPRLIVRWVPKDLQSRLQHRLHTEEEDYR